MARRLSFGRFARVSVAFVSLTACAATNPIPTGERIPNTQIVSCGDDLRDLAAPAGGLVNGSIKLSGGKTVLTGSVTWEASCPSGVDSDAQTEFVLSRTTVYEDDAGYPGQEIGQTAFALDAVLSCANRTIRDIGGVSKSQDFGPTPVVDLTDLCKEYQAMPMLSPLFVQVELTGDATTCSSDTFPLHFRSKIDVTCGP